MNDPNTYGRHSMENTPPDGPIIDEFLLMTEYANRQPKHRLTQVTQLGDMANLVYYADHLGGFVRAEKPFEVIC